MKRKKDKFEAGKKSVPDLYELIRKYDYEIFTSHDDIGEVLEALRWLALLMMSFDGNPNLNDKESMRGFGCVLQIMSNQLAHVNRDLDKVRNFSLNERKVFS